MRTNALLASGALFVTLALPSIASAQNAYSTGDVNMRAGPGTRYPVVTTVPEGRALTIHGCIEGYDWCDVTWRGNRGWVFGDYVEYLYRGRRVVVGEYGPRIDLPIITFSFGNYWDRYYRDRPWFDDRDRWWDGRGGRDRDDWDGRDRGDWNDRGREDWDDDRRGRDDDDRQDRDDDDWQGRGDDSQRGEGQRRDGDDDGDQRRGADRDDRNQVQEQRGRDGQDDETDRRDRQRAGGEEERRSRSRECDPRQDPGCELPGMNDRRDRGNDDESRRGGDQQ